MPTTLVTGASGFIGPILVERLQSAGRQVACLVRKSSDVSRLTPLGVELRSGDVTDAGSLPAALAGVNEVYHLAGRLHAWSYDDFLRVNEAGVTNLLTACTTRDSPPTIVLVSSQAAAGPSTAERPRNEADPPQPVSNYGRSKLAGEQAARPFSHAAPITIVRPPVVFGPGDRDGLALFQAIKRTGLHVIPNKQGLPLSLIHATDLADALLLTAERGERLEYGAARPDVGLYFAADPTISSYAQMGQLAALAMGVPVRVIKLRRWPFILPALVMEGVGRLRNKPALISLDKLREASQAGWVCSPAKAQRQLGFQVAAPLAERYRQTAEWYRANGWL